MEFPNRYQRLVKESHIRAKQDGLNVHQERGRATLVGIIMRTYEVDPDRNSPAELVKACMEYQSKGEEASYFSLKRIRGDSE